MGSPGVEASILEVELSGQTHRLRWQREHSLIDAMLEAGLNPPFSCKAGKCSACACQLISGEVAMDNNDILTEDDIAEGFILSCQSKPVTQEVRVRF